MLVELKGLLCQTHPLQPVSHKKLVAPNRVYFLYKITLDQMVIAGLHNRCKIELIIKVGHTYNKNKEPIHLKAPHTAKFYNERKGTHRPILTENGASAANWKMPRGTPFYVCIQNEHPSP